MGHGPEGHIEHGEHAAHAAHNPFDRKVSMTIAIVAAALACVTLASHRAHNATLVYQAEANRLQTEANIKHTQASDQWNYYQAKNLLQRLYQSDQRLMTSLTKDPAMASERAAADKFWNGETNKYKDRLPTMEREARAITEEAKALQLQALARIEKAEEVHHQANRFDWGELAVEMAVVLCSIAVLTKQKGYWFTGIVSGIVGVLIAASAFLVH
jgi:hypothetical protein